MCKYSRYNSYRARRGKFLLYIFFLAVISFSFVLMPIAESLKEWSFVPLLLVGVLFWVGAVGLLIVLININYSRRNSAEFKRMYPDLRRFGLVSFFKNAPAAIADILLFISLTGEIILLIFTDLYYLKFIGIAVIVFSFGMHCMLNGVNYIYVNYNIRRDRKS